MNLVLTKSLSCALALSLTLSALPQQALAQLISTEDMLTQSQAQGPGSAVSPSEHSRERLRGFLARADVEAALREQGVDAAAARERVQALSDDELAQLDRRIAQAPAGGEVLGLVFSVFVLLLVTDILGFTKVFPFTRSIR